MSLVREYRSQDVPNYRVPNLADVPKVPLVTINYEPRTRSAKRFFDDLRGRAVWREARHQRLRKERARDWLRNPVHRASGLGANLWVDVPFVLIADGTPVSNATNEQPLFSASSNVQPVVPTNWLARPEAAADFKAAGIFSTYATPTLTFQLRLGSTAGTLTLTGTSIGVSAAITTAAGASNAFWNLEYRMESRTINTPGAGNTTISGCGFVHSGSFASPFIYSLIQSAGSATFTLTVQSDVQLYLNASVTWSVANVVNTITMKQARMYFLN